MDSARFIPRPRTPGPFGEGSCYGQDALGRHAEEALMQGPLSGFLNVHGRRLQPLYLWGNAPLTHSLRLLLLCASQHNPVVMVGIRLSVVFMDFAYKGFFSSMSIPENTSCLIHLCACRSGCLHFLSGWQNTPSMMG